MIRACNTLLARHVTHVTKISPDQEQMITMAIRMQLIAEQWEWQMDQLMLIRLRIS